MRTRIALLFALVSLAVLTTQALAGNEKIQLRLHLKEGQKFGLKTVENDHITITLASTVVPISMKSSYGLMFEVTKVDNDGSAALKVTYKTVGISFSGGGINLDYDSANPASKNSPWAGLVAGQVGRTLTMRVSPEGRVSDVQGTSNQGKEMLEGLFTVYPSAPVALGERWSTTAAETTIPCIMTHYLKITDRTDGSANVKEYVDIKPNAKAPEMALPGWKAKVSLSGTAQGNTTVDEATGLPVSGSGTGHITGTCDVTEGSKTGRGYLTIDSTMSVDRFYSTDSN